MRDTVVMVVRWRETSGLLRAAVFVSVGVIVGAVILIVLVAGGAVAPGVAVLIVVPLTVAHAVFLGIVRGVEVRRERDRIVRRVEEEDRLRAS